MSCSVLCINSLIYIKNKLVTLKNKVYDIITSCERTMDYNVINLEEVIVDKQPRKDLIIDNDKYEYDFL
tara:strand:- start:790 stop:996 length:207 start_codon:yes stop_codon:yes gene_type:complete